MLLNLPTMTAREKAILNRIERMQAALTNAAGMLSAYALIFTKDGYPLAADDAEKQAEECRVAAGYAKATHHYDDRDQT